MEEDFSPVRSFLLPEPIAGPSAGTSPDVYLREKDQLSAHAVTIASSLPDELRTMFQQLRLNIASGVHVKGAFLPTENDCTPKGFVDISCDPASWLPANVATALARALEIFLCSYRSENDGKLFVHLVPVEGDSAIALKSRRPMRGHTDGVALPLPDEATAYSDLAPSPDLVILVGVRNPDLVSTNLAPLSVIMRKLSGEAIKVLQEPLYDFTPQKTFELAPKFVLSKKPVILKTANEGYLIRFSHTNVTVSNGDGKAEAALEELKAAIAGSFSGVAIAPGDILFVNNRTALHGRSEILAKATGKRWLLRTYGMYADYSRLASPDGADFCLLPQKDGPTQIIAP